MSMPPLLPTKPDTLGSNRGSHTLLAGEYNVQPLWEITQQFLKHTRAMRPGHFILGINPREIQARVCRKIHTQMVIGNLLVIASS